MPNRLKRGGRGVVGVVGGGGGGGRGWWGEGVGVVVGTMQQNLLKRRHVPPWSCYLCNRS